MSGPKSNRTTKVIDDFAEALMHHEWSEWSKKGGGSPWPHIIDYRPFRAKALRWLIIEKPKIASLIKSSGGGPKSAADLSRLLANEYGSLASRLAPVVVDLGIASLANRARSANLADDDRIDILTRLGLWDETVPLLRKRVAELSGKDRLIYMNNLAYSLFRSGSEQELEEAKSLVKSVLDEQPFTSLAAAANDTLAVILFRTGDFENAREAVEKALQLAEQAGCEHPAGYHHCYQIYSELSLTEQAEHSLRIACEMVGGPQRILEASTLRRCLIGEDEIVEIIDDWFLSDSLLSQIADLIESELPQAVGRETPASERDVSDRIATMLRFAGLHPLRESVQVPYSLKTYTPDFVLPDASTVVEVKLSSTPGTVERIIAEINDDKVAYLTRYARVLFVVYDMGYIHDPEQFKQGMEQVGVTVVLVQHRQQQPFDALPAKILFLAADPTDASRLRLGQELREVQEKLQLAKLRERFELHQRMSVRPADISQALLDIRPLIVHFSGHGTTTGALCVENQIGGTHPIQPDALAALFEQFADQVRCVVLNACYSESQANAIARHIDYVIGMSRAIDDESAIAFAIGFYQALGAGCTVEGAYKLGCVQIKLQGVSEHLIPVLTKKAQARQ